MNQYYMHDNRTPEAIAAASQLYGKEVGMVKTLSDEIKEARVEEIDAKERASKSRVDIFSNEKGKEQNRQYQEYLEGSIKENFDTKVALVEERLALMEEISNMRITLANEKAETELAIKRRKAEADLEYENLKKKINGIKYHKVKMWVWRILWPMVGLAVGVLSFALLFMI